ncbi:hypothetical protein T310_8954, partial [Rasamsonia emersonii CBS 393.64]
APAPLQTGKPSTIWSRLRTKTGHRESSIRQDQPSHRCAAGFSSGECAPGAHGAGVPSRVEGTDRSAHREADKRIFGSPLKPFVDGTQLRRQAPFRNEILPPPPLHYV